MPKHPLARALLAPKGKPKKPDKLESAQAQGERLEVSIKELEQKKAALRREAIKRDSQRWDKLLDDMAQVLGKVERIAVELQEVAENGIAAPSVERLEAFRDEMESVVIEAAARFREVVPTPATAVKQDLNLRLDVTSRDADGNILGVNVTPRSSGERTVH